jgi:hypothetical protein
VPWRQNLLFQLLTLAVYEEAQAVIKAALPKPKKAGAAAQRPGGQAALFQQMMRSRLPPTNYFVEQMVEGEWCRGGLGVLAGAAGLGGAADWAGGAISHEPGAPKTHSQCVCNLLLLLTSQPHPPALVLHRRAEAGRLAGARGPL